MIAFDLDMDTGELTSEGQTLGVAKDQMDASMKVCEHLCLCGDDTEISMNGHVKELGDLRDWLSRVVSETECENEPIH